MNIPCHHNSLSTMQRQTVTMLIKLNSVDGSYSDFKFMGQTNLDDLTKAFLTINRYGLYSSSNFSSANVVFGSTTLSTSGGIDAVFMRYF